MAALAINRLNLSARGYNRMLKIARTVADLDSSPNIEVNHFSEALQYRPRLKQANAVSITTQATPVISANTKR